MKQFVIFTAVLSMETDEGGIEEREILEAINMRDPMDSGFMAFNNLAVATRVHQAIKDKLERHYAKGDCDLYDARHANKKDADA